MRLVVQRSEALGSRFVCANCRLNIIHGRLGSSRFLLSYDFAQGIFRPFATESRAPGLEYSKQRSGWEQLPRAERIAPFLSIHSAPSIPSKPLEGIGVMEEEELPIVQKSFCSDIINELRDGRDEALFYKTLQSRQPDLIMAAMLDPLNRDILSSLPDPTFVDAFLLLSPKYFILPYRDISYPLHPSQVHYRRIRDIDKIFSDFASSLGYIVRTRRHTGHKLGLEEYKHLMESAATMGNFPMAETVLNDMRIDSVTADLRCYNFYLEAMVWDNLYSGLEKYRVRVTPFYYRKRRFDHPTPGWEGYGTAGKSVRKRALEVFSEMTGQGIEGDVNTFASIFLASARVGHTRGMAGILKTVWNIDVDLLGQQGEAAHPPVASISPSSSLYPNDYLLFAIAHGLGCNNDMSKAVRVVDFIAQQYKLTIKSAVWRELLERSYQHSKNRFGPDAVRNSRGRISPEFVSGIHNLMITSPFNVHTRMDEYRRFARMHWEQLDLDKFLSALDEAYCLIQKTRKRCKAARLVVEDFLSSPFSLKNTNTRLAIPEWILCSPNFVSAVHDYDILRMLVQQQTVLMERMVSSIFIQTRWMGRDNPKWERVIVPRLIYEWQDFLRPSHTEYLLRGKLGTGGVVRIEGPWRRRSRDVRVRYSIEQEKPVEGDAYEVGDDILWANYREKLDDDTANRIPLCRLFGEYRLPSVH